MATPRALKGLLRRPGLQRFIASAMANYLSLVHRTNPMVSVPADLQDRVRALSPAIIAFWHGQHLMIPYLRTPDLSFKILVSPSAEAESLVLYNERVGVGTIRASGAHKASDIGRKRGVQGFILMVRALREGHNVVLTPDVPRGPARVVGLGTMMLAQRSGRPIVPIACATSRRFVLKRSWDKATINLPFGRSAAVLGDPIHVPPDISDEDIEALRLQVQDALDSVMRRAYAIVDGRSEEEAAR